MWSGCCTLTGCESTLNAGKCSRRRAGRTADIKWRRRLRQGRRVATLGEIAPFVKLLAHGRHQDICVKGQRGGKAEGIEGHKKMLVN